MDNKKRVINLYRASTKKQVEFNDTNQADIPMQRIECMKFIEQMGWTLIAEYQEEGVSGFKVSAENRDKIQIIKDRAVKGDFDVLLVFMFDRVGRIASETPFIVEWFVNQGVEVWSTQEGEQRFENDVDHLMNYIRYWQSEGESRKTSVRTRTRLGQIVEEGHIKGGLAPYGYRYEKSNRVNKRGKELLKLVVDDYESMIVCDMFALFTEKGYGAHKIASYLHEQGYVNRSGKNWHHASIRGILRNPTYNGYLRSGEHRSEQLNDILIIDDKTFQTAQSIIERRSKPNNRSVPMNSMGEGLLSGNVFCGHCNSRLHKTVSVKSTKSKEPYVRRRYSCYGKTHRQTNCDGQTGYTMHKLDAVIYDIVRNIFLNFGTASKEELVGDSFDKQEKALKGERKRHLREFERIDNKLLTLNNEIVNALSGESKFTAEQLSEAIAITKNQRDTHEENLGLLNQQIADIENVRSHMDNKYDQVVTWASIFEKADIAEQRMIVAQLIEKVTVYKGYEVNIKFNIDVNCFDLTSVQVILGDENVIQSIPNAS